LVPVTPIAEGRCWIAERLARRDGRGAASVAHDERRERGARGILDDGGGRAGGRRGGEVVVAIERGAAHGDEEGPASHAPAVVRDIREGAGHPA
jgi:hypothetical protein